MQKILSTIKYHKIKLLRLFITLSVILFLLCSFMTLLYEYSRDYFRALTILYMIFVVNCLMLSEFSPYVLQNYLVFIFPFLLHYLGRGAIFLMVGALYISPAMGKMSNYAGICFIFVGMSCLLMHWIISREETLNVNFLLKNNENSDDFINMSKIELMTTSRDAH